jgi:hypothetical protein
MKVVAVEPSAVAEGDLSFGVMTERQLRFLKHRYQV